MSPLVGYILETIVTVIAISALAVLVLYGARRVGVGHPSGPLSLLGRLPLEGRRAVYLVEVGTTVYVLGGSEAGLEKLGEVAKDDIKGLMAPEAPSFRQVFARVWRDGRVWKDGRRAREEAKHGDHDH